MNVSKNPKNFQRRLTRRIPMRPRPVSVPDDAQLVFWALREGILQNLSPGESNLPHSKISIDTMLRLRKLYAASLIRWHEKEKKELEELNRNKPSIADEVRRFFGDF